MRACDSCDVITHATQRTATRSVHVDEGGVRNAGGGGNERPPIRIKCLKVSKSLRSVRARSVR